MTDLSPLKKMGVSLRSLILAGTKVMDLTPLKGMDLKELHPPANEQLTPESIEFIKELRKSCKVVGWD